MPAVSMTGYGKSESVFNGSPCVVEVRSLNGRFLEATFKLPKELAYFEGELRALLKAKLARGSVSVAVTLGEGETGTVPKAYNAEAVEALQKIAAELREKYGVKGELELGHLLSLPEFLRYEQAGEDSASLERHVLAELSKALDTLVAMRKKEGENLAKDLTARVSKLEGTLSEIAKLDPERIVAWRNKFEERLKLLLGETSLDPARILQEASIVADRLDINEEITRFKSHNKLFLETLASAEPEGKKLNFILQEMAREANTLGTKCQDAKIQALAISLKDEVETMREQVMNIE